MPTKTIQLEPHLRIERAGCKVSISNIRLDDGVIRHRVCLMRKGAAVACETVARNGSLPLTELGKRIRRGLIRPSSDTYRALLVLAKIAEDFFGEEVAE